MPKITLTPHGIKAGRAAGSNKAPPKRGKTKGWSAATARRNRDFLKSINPTLLDGHSISASLTLGRTYCVMPADMQSIRQNFFKRLDREKVSRHHWVMEFQRDGTPHLHMMIFFPDFIHPEAARELVRRHWIEVTQLTGAEPWGQHIVPVHALTGWLQYLAKHGARGADHYQRSMPKGWETPGRMWGKSGQWPTSVQEFDCDKSTFYTLRRWVRNWRLSDARKDLRKSRLHCDDRGEQIALRRIRSARRLLNRGSRMKSELLGFDEWAGPNVILPMIALLMSRSGAYWRDYADAKASPYTYPVTQGQYS